MMFLRTKTFLKRVLIRALAHPRVCTILNPLTGCVGTIFMLHRFTDAGRGISGHPRCFVEQILQLVRRRNYHVVSLKDMIASMDSGDRRSNHRIAFTFDDGTYDQAEIGASLFLQYDCPVSIFLITGFVDQVLWPWDDQVVYIFQQTARDSLAISVGGQIVSYDLRSSSERSIAINDFQLRCKLLSEQDLEAAVQNLAELAEISVPQQPPPQFRSMTWDKARELERTGLVSFGPHSVTHKILPRMSADRARGEVVDSWQRVRQELLEPLPVFNFPTGIYGEREVSFVREAGILHYVASDTGYVYRGGQLDESLPRRLDRFVFPQTMDDFLQYSTWIEWSKERFRARVR